MPTGLDVLMTALMLNVQAAFDSTCLLTRLYALA